MSAELFLNTPNRSKKCRETTRKRLLREVLELRAEEGILLDEARWQVVGEKLTECQDSNERRSLLNSFSRTVREQLPPQFEVRKISISQETPVGLVARAAVYRQKDVSAIRGFLASRDACILCRYQTNLKASERHYHARYKTPHFHAATFRFFQRQLTEDTYCRLQEQPGTFIPTTQELTIIVARGSDAKLLEVANVSWKLLGDGGLDTWFDVDGSAPLLSVLRNNF